MRIYGQFCPIARTSEILGERWTPIIVRNLLLGCKTFTEIAAGAPGISRGLLTKRLRELERADVIEIQRKPDGHGSLYELTPEGRELWHVIQAMSTWGTKWLEIAPAHSHPDVVLWSWSHVYLERSCLPKRRVVVRFEFPDQDKRHRRFWLLFEEGGAEVCEKSPGFDEDLVVIADSLAFARWHLGVIEWTDALRSGDIEVSGPPTLARALPAWNRRAIRSEPSLTDTPNAVGHASSHSAQTNMIAGFTGQLLTPHDDGYDHCRTVWNGAVDRRPRYIARCHSPADVIAALHFTRENELPLAVRSGGHGVAGTAVCDEGLVMDLSPMKRVQVDPSARTARAGAGMRWGELDAATQAFGLATTGGVVSHTGIAGLTLGGGIGWLMRRHGLTVDNLLSVDVVTAEGRCVTASEHEHPDLFWALRGGGGNFGIATSFAYRLHPVGPNVLSGPVLWAMEDTPELLRFYREFVAEAPSEVATIVNLRKVPPLPILPNELHGRPACIITMLYVGDPAAGERALKKLRGFGRPLLDLVDLRPYAALQSHLDATVPHGWHYYWKSSELGPLEDGIVDLLFEHSARIHSTRSYTVIFQLGGAVADVDENATAYSHRDATHNVNINGVWLPQEAIGVEEMAWARSFFAALEPHQEGVYVNFLDRDDHTRVRAAYGDAKYRRLLDLKNRYDPDNVFKLNQNIGPPDKAVSHPEPAE